MGFIPPFSQMGSILALSPGATMREIVRTDSIL
jgi:hypothetical protein